MGKVCTKCKIWREIERFGVNRRDNRVNSWCNDCQAARMRDRSIPPDPDLVAKMCIRCDQMKTMENFRLCDSNADGYRSSCRDCEQRDRRAWKYGVSVDWYDETFARQEGRCAICETPADVLAVDHDHSCCPEERSCGLCVRDLICKPCNWGLGQFGDDPDRLARASEYIREHQPWKGGG